MSMSTEYVIDRLDEATRVNRDAKQVCNDALCLARGRIQKLQIDIEWKDAQITALNKQIADLKAREMVEGNCEIVQDSSGNLTIKCSSGSDENRWIPCSERMPGVFQDVFMKIRDTMFQERYIVPRFGYITGSNAWQIYGLPGNMINLPNGFEVIAWRPVPEDYKEFRVEEEESVEEEVKFEIGDFVLCVSKAGVKINAVYLREDEKHYWILDKNCLTQQPLDKNHWKLTKYPGHMSVVEWLTCMPVS